MIFISVEKGVTGWRIWQEVRRERMEAHTHFGENSIEYVDPTSMARLSILLEEVGEVAREFNESQKHSEGINKDRLTKELIQVAAVAGAWADALLRAVVE